MSNNPLSLNSMEWLTHYMKGECEQLSSKFLDILTHFHNQTYYGMGPQEQLFLNNFVKNFLFIFSQPEFVIPDAHILQYVRMNRVISNVVYLTEQKTTDAALDVVKMQQGNFIKILTLWSARNSVKFDRKAFFDINPELASLWYLVYSYIFYPGLATERCYNNLREHFQFRHPNLKIFSEIQEIYFGSTYAGPDMDRGVKEIVNLSMKEILAKLPLIRNKPNPNKIAVMSACWFPTHSVYRNYAAYVRALKEKYHLTFFQLGRFNQPDLSMFNASDVIDIKDGLPDIGKLQDNDFQAIYYPDIGMSPHSIFLANARIAPVQFCSPGHSVSTWGADIDYYFTGKDVEIDNVQSNYSEKAVLLPGMGVIHNKPLYTPQGLKKTTKDVIVNCPWTCQKINYPFVRTLQKIKERVTIPFKFRVFIGASAYRQNDYLPFVRDMRNMLADSVEIHANLEYPEYMARMEEGDLTLDSFHFGGCNIVSDSLFLRKPIVTWRGTKWYNRIGSRMLEMVGMKHWAATYEDEYIIKACNLISFEKRRDNVARLLEKVDLDATIYSTDDAKFFVSAVEKIIAEKNNGKGASE